MGHDLDDDELKATKNKFYKYNKDEFDKNHVFILSDDKKDLSKINKTNFENLFKYIKMLQNIYEHCDIIDIDDFTEISNYMIDQEMKIKELKDKIEGIRDKSEVMDYYSLNDVIDDLSKLIGDYEENE